MLGYKTKEVKGETHCAMRWLLMAFNGLKNVNFIE